MRWTRAAGRLLMTAVVVVAGYSGTGVAAQDRAATRGPITLATGRDLTGYLHRVLSGWNHAHPGERVTLVQLPEATDEVRAQMEESLASGSSRFDVLNIDVAWTAEFAGARWIAPVDRRTLPLERMLPNVASTAEYRGRLYAAPYTTDAGLLYYRKDILAKAGVRPPRTWAELAHDASVIAPRYGMAGYAGQYLPYEGLTVNVDEAVMSAGGSLLTPDGRDAAVDSPAALKGLGFLVRGLREGWIPRAALSYKEEESRKAFQNGKLLFLRNWPYVYSLASGRGSAVAGRFGVVPLPGPGGPGVSVLGGSSLAVNARSRHPATAARLLSYLTSAAVQRQVLTRGSLPPVRAGVYDDPVLIDRYPYLPVLKKSVERARSRSQTSRYDQVSLAVSAIAGDALRGRTSPPTALGRLRSELRSILRSEAHS